MFVKICGITNLDDGLLAAGLGADAIGLNFAASTRRITKGRAAEIVRRLPPDTLSIGIFRDERKERVVEIANTLGLSGVQLHGDESPEDTRWIAERVQNVIRAFAYDHHGLVKLDDYGPHRLLIDSSQPGSGEVFDWNRLDEVAGTREFILAGGLNPDNVAEAINKAKPWGVDVASGVESSPGTKDPTKVRKFIANARAAASKVSE